jgi:hypothetical protein
MNSPTIWPVTTRQARVNLAKVARLTAARDHAKGRVLGEYPLLPPDEDRPVIADRGHPSWAEVDAEQRERLGDPLSEEGRP